LSFTYKNPDPKLATDDNSEPQLTATITDSEPFETYLSTLLSGEKKLTWKRR